MSSLPSTRTQPALGSRLPARFVRAALGLATSAMLALHLLQPCLNPLEEPVSFYFHGAHGWLLPCTMACFGAAALVLGPAVGDGHRERWTSFPLIVVGAGMLVAAFVPSDRWFPWEAAPTISGLVHAVAAVFSPPLLLLSMLTSGRWRRGGWDRISGILVVAYAAALVASAVSLAIGFAVAGPPPMIGLAERVLAVTGASWLGITASRTPARPTPPASDDSGA
jgi:hypothetical protein